MAEQLRLFSQSLPPEKEPKFNPRPHGQLVAGSTTDLVLKLLQSRTGFVTHAQIIFAIKKDRGAVAWSLKFLYQQKLIRTTTDARNTRYLRYAAVSVIERGKE